MSGRPWGWEGVDRCWNRSFSLYNKIFQKWHLALFYIAPCSEVPTTLYVRFIYQCIHCDPFSTVVGISIGVNSAHADMQIIHQLEAKVHVHISGMRI